MNYIKHNYSFYSLSKKQTYILKAIAIVMIVLHNYVKGFTFLQIGENEFSFDFNLYIKYIEVAFSEPYYLLELILAFWGHYGVQIFIFISAFGLTKLFNNGLYSSILKYIFKYYIKLSFLLIFGLIVCISLSYNLGIIGSRLMFVKIYFTPLNLMIFGDAPGEFGFIVGAWWYFGLAFQLYILFPLIYLLLNKCSKKGYSYLCFVYLFFSYAMLYSSDSLMIFKFQRSILGHLPEVLLGVFMAKQKDFRISKFIFFISIVIFLLSNVYKFLFPFSFVSALIVLLVVCKALLFSKKMQSNKLLLYIGKISVMLFLVNSVCRVYAYRYLPEIPILSMAIYFAVLVLFCSIAYFVFKNTFQKIEFWIFRKLKI